ncbi:MAG: EcsC family protein [Clostridia bacterium]|nr:EcsC family protein [Clostridia bacterium]
MKHGEKTLVHSDIMKLLDICYEKSIEGIPRVSPSVKEMATEYLEKTSTSNQACKEMIKNQIIKCTTSGFLTGFGGFVTLPVTLPANISSVLYVQMRMIACAAYMAGFDLEGDETQTIVYACLAGVAINELLKQAGIKLGVKLSNSLIKKLPGKVLTKINQKVGFRFITKFGTKGVINLGKLVPGVGAVVGGSLDLIETKAIGDRTYKWFFEGNYVYDKKAEEAAASIELIGFENEKENE